ncbi:glycerol kinase GlpK [Clostridium tarantellae]|uniref:Glycerol kinase n=1 Tax=Clostridium tarantellae TaxID=39493 RepID=A0A6I1ML78_9CLOT|nr:glycerol kinase GlpK [Clostridium tarantellae]MPQ43734.1 glycerol kinase GlpK [Clostridium tarantellae]
MKKLIMALDQGTTSSRCILFDRDGKVVSIAQKEFSQYYPKPGWVEQDGMEIWSTQYGVAIEAIAKVGVTLDDIHCIGIANQRETTLIWDKKTGSPIYNALVWQCRRTAEYCDELKSLGYEQIIKEKTGLRLDAYFSASKIKWLLDNVKDARKKAESGELLFGTIDTWILWNLTKGKVHATDYTNASRTLLFNINTLKWDNELLKIFNIPKSILPEVYPSAYTFGKVDSSILGKEIIISGMAGDQQASLFGQACFKEGSIKNTYGTGCFMLMNTGRKRIDSKSGLLTTIAWGIENDVFYALEGSIFVAGAAIKWLKDDMRMIKSPQETEMYARRVENTNGVYFVPAFVGLGAPYWDPYARGILMGLTRSAKKEHVVRSVLESLAYQTYDIVKAMEKDSKIKLTELKVDGGVSVNDFLMKFQADILNTTVSVPLISETTALGAAYLAGIGANYWCNSEEIEKSFNIRKRFNGTMECEERINLINGWHDAVKRCR